MNLLMRSKLFVPADKPEWFGKALDSEADAVCFDLEDAVSPARKEEARENLRRFFCRDLRTAKTLLVRVNRVTSSEFEKDLCAIVSPSVAVVAIPKVNDPKEIHQAVAALASLEQSCGAAPSILATIESPRGLRLAHEIAGSDGRISGLQLGLADLLAPLGMKTDHADAAQQVRFRLRLAAGEAGIPCYDSAFADFRNEEGFVREAMAARKMGFAGKSCIHPAQIGIANRIFSPTAEEVDEARRIVDAAQQAENSGKGVFAVDGQMVDAPFVKRALAILQLAQRIAGGGNP